MGRKVKVQLFRGERIYDIYDYIKAPITKSTNNIILYIGVNYSIKEYRREVISKLLDSKQFIDKTLSKVKL